VVATTARTRAALQAIVDARLSAAHVPCSRDDPRIVKYRPAWQSAAFNSGAEEQIVRVEPPVPAMIAAAPRVVGGHVGLEDRAQSLRLEEPREWDCNSFFCAEIF
jgi:hypothetical protein